MRFGQLGPDRCELLARAVEHLAPRVDSAVDEASQRFEIRNRCSLAGENWGVAAHTTERATGRVPMARGFSDLAELTRRERAPARSGVGEPSHVAYTVEGE